MCDRLLFPPHPCTLQRGKQTSTYCMDPALCIILGCLLFIIAHSLWHRISPQCNATRTGRPPINRSRFHLAHFQLLLVLLIMPSQHPICSKDTQLLVVIFMGNVKIQRICKRAGPNPPSLQTTLSFTSYFNLSICSWNMHNSLSFYDQNVFCIFVPAVLPACICLRA